MRSAENHIYDPLENPGLYGIGNLGNVCTDRVYRRQGLAAACVNAVVRELLSAGCRYVFLNVEVENAPAIGLYESVGFQTHCTYFEGVGKKKM